MAYRNPYVLTIDVEFSKPLDEGPAKAAANLLVEDIAEGLKAVSDDGVWGWGRSVVVNVYPHVEVPS